MRTRITITLLIALATTAPAHAERVELPLPNTLEEKPVSDQTNSLWPALVISFVATAASGGKAVFFPLVGPSDAPVLFQTTTPGQTPEEADESFRIVRHSKTMTDDCAEAETLVKDLTKICPDFPAKLLTIANGTFLVERESTNCLQPGFRLTISRYLKGSEATYQAVYLARRQRPSDELLQAWRVRLSEAKVVP